MIISEGTIQNSSKKIVPFLKWAGGKRWLVQSRPDLIPTAIKGRYFEPFIGGGSMFTRVLPERAVLSDKNQELANVYHQVRLHWQKIQKGLAEFQALHSENFYYKVRALEEPRSLERAIRFIYLNRTCFNGLYRVNRAGKFNVPKGTKSNVILPDDDFHSWSIALQNAEIFASDFENVINQAGQGDFIFADPPYTVLHNHNCFLKYNEILFSWSDQERLAEALWRAALRGAKILATNANYPRIKDLYNNRFIVEPISRASTIAADSSKRGQYEELIIRTPGG